MIFNKNKVWNAKPIQQTLNKIKQLNKVIKVLQVLELKAEDIQLKKDKKIIETALKAPILHQVDHKANDLDNNNDNNKVKKQAKEEDFL